MWRLALRGRIECHGVYAVTTFLVRRLLQAVPTLLLVSIIVFAIMRATPGDPARAALGNAFGVTDQVLATVRHQMGLDEPVYVQYLYWLGNVVPVSRDWAESLAIIKPLPGRAARDGEQCLLRRRRRRDLATTKSHGGPPRACHTDTNSETAKPDRKRHV